MVNMPQTITLNSALLDYYDTRLKRLAPNSRRGAEQALERMRSWLVKETQPNVYLSDIDDRLVVRFFNRLLPPGHQASTYNCYRQRCWAFWSFCCGEGWIQVNPMRHVDRLPQPKRVRLLLSPDEMQQMLDDASPRDRFCLALGMNTALRSCDISRLTIGDLNLGNNTLQVYIAKSRTEDVLPVTAELREEALRWLPEYGKLAGVEWRQLPNVWPLVPALQTAPAPGAVRTMVTTVNAGVPLWHLERIVQVALGRLGHPTKGEGMHTLRRSALRALFDLAGADGIGDPIRIPQALAGHKSRNTTELYLGITYEKQQRDDMLRGRSFLGRAAELQRQRNHDTDGLRVVQ